MNREGIQSWADSIAINPRSAILSDYFARPFDSTDLGEVSDFNHHQTDRPSKRRRISTSSRGGQVMGPDPSETESVSALSEDSWPSSRIEKRPKLIPTAPSSRSRSPSPTRKQIALLERTQPAVKMRPRGSLSTFQKAHDLHILIQQDFGVGVIPGSLKGHLQTANPVKFTEIPSYSFDNTSGEPPPETLYLWEQVDKIYQEAQRCDTRHKDENAWMSVAWKVLELGMEQAGVSSLEINSVQCQLINDKCLPKCEGLPSTRKKADLSFAFTPDIEDVEAVYNRFQAQFPKNDLSHLTDAYTGTLLISYALEGKKAGGNLDEARLQLAVFHLAALQKLKNLFQYASQSIIIDLADIPPMVGWVMVGHEWKCFITSFSADGNIAFEHTLDNDVIGTESYLSIFRTVDTIKRTCKNLDQVVWPAMSLLIKTCVEVGSREATSFPPRAVDLL